MERIRFLPIRKERFALCYGVIGNIKNNHLLQKLIKKKLTVIAKIAGVFPVLTDKSLIGNEDFLTINKP
jgi:hypothetical protein